MPVSCGGPQDARVAVASRGDGVVGLQEAPRLRLPRLRASYSQVLEDGLLVSPEVAVPASDGVDQRQGPRPDRPPLREAAVGVGGRERRPCGAWLGELFRYGGCPDRRGASAAIIGVDGQTVAVGSARRGPAGGSESAVRRELRSSAVTSEHESGIAPDVTVASAGLGARPEVGAARAQALQALRLRPPEGRSGVCSW